jgi:hypothetical protein
MSFYRTRSFSFIAGMVLFGFGLVTWRARKIAEPKMQRSIALGHCHAYLMAGMMTLSQQIALWGTRGGWISAEFFLVLAVVFGYLGYIVLAGAIRPKLQRLSNGYVLYFCDQRPDRLFHLCRRIVPIVCAYST